VNPNWYFVWATNTKKTSRATTETQVEFHPWHQDWFPNEKNDKTPWSRLQPVTTLRGVAAVSNTTISRVESYLHGQTIIELYNSCHGLWIARQYFLEIFLLSTDLDVCSVLFTFKHPNIGLFRGCLSLNLSHSIHVWYIYPHLPQIWTKCREIYHTWMVCVHGCLHFPSQQSYESSMYILRFGWSVNPRLKKNTDKFRAYRVVGRHKN